jgi:hypothetical protein
MSAIFISHSSKDNAKARELRDLLEREGHRSIFLDFDPEQGIPAGRDWEQELYAQLRASQAVIVICSPDSMQSNWCFAEITHAKALGKQIFPMKVGDCVINRVLTSRQVLDFTKNPADDLYQRLWRGLKMAGLDPASAFDWDGKRPPYPGLMAFDEKDAAVFFGREPEIQQGLELLNRLRQFGGARVVVVLGASGSGKSSLVRAGIVPRLTRDSERWLVLPPFRPGHNPLRALAVSLAETLKRHGGAASVDGIHDLLKAADPADAARALIEAADEIRTAAGHREASVVLVIDQLEELLTYGGGAGAQQLLPVLEAASTAQGSPLMTIATLRSDFLGDLQLHPAARTFAFEALQLGPMPKERLIKVIEGPAEMAGLRLERGLTEAMINDTETDDALPLLAFTLRELYEKHGDDKILHVQEYREALGGLAGSVAKAAEAVYEAIPLTPERELDLRRAFRSLVRINEEGKYVRQAAARRDLPESIRDVLERFVQARLLVAAGQGENQVLEVAHEALFRSWERLRLWLDEDREFLLWQQRLRASAEGWKRTSRDAGALLRGASLAEAERHFENHPDELRALDREYIAESLEQRRREQEEQEAARAERERVQKRHNQRLRVFLAIALALTLAAVWLWYSANQAKQEALAAKQATISEVITASWKAGTYLPPIDEAALAKQAESSQSHLPGGRDLYARLKVIMDLQKLKSLAAPLPVFTSGPHGADFDFKSNQFGHYNPAFVRWAGDNLIPAADNADLRKLTQRVYDTYLREMARYYFLAHTDLAKDTQCRTRMTAEYEKKLKDYEKRPWKEDEGPGDLFVDATQDYLRAIEDGNKQGERRGWSTASAPYHASVAIGFWIRRDMDRTSGEFLNVLRKLLNTYDADWLKAPQAATGTGQPIRCDESLAEMDRLREQARTQRKAR